MPEKGEWILAWYRKCGHAEEYIERACAAGALVELKDWTCNEYKDFKGDNKTIKKCPGCGARTEETSGCSFITFTVPGCGTH